MRPREAPDVLEIALDTPDHAQVQPFYQALLGYDVKRDDELVDGAGRTPTVWFQDTDSDAPDRQRWHLDVSVPHDVAEARIQAVDRCRRTARRRQPRPGVLGARGPGGQPFVHLHLAVPRLRPAPDGARRMVGSRSHHPGRLAH